MRNCCFLLFILLPCLLTAQTATDEVHLLSGQTYIGMVIEQRPGVSIRLWRLPEKDTLTFAMEEIERITRIVPALEASKASVVPAPIPADTPPVFRRNVLLIQTCIGGGDYSFGGLGVTLSRRLGRQDKTWLGLSTQYIGNTTNGDAVQIFPIMADLRQEFKRSSNGRLATMLFLDGGYVVSIGSDSYLGEQVEYGNGWVIHPGLAFKLNLFPNAGLMLDVGWIYHAGKTHWITPADRPDGTKAWSNGLVRGSIFF